MLAQRLSSCYNYAAPEAWDTLAQPDEHSLHQPHLHSFLIHICKEALHTQCSTQRTGVWTCCNFVIQRSSSGLLVGLPLQGLLERRPVKENLQERTYSIGTRDEGLHV